MTYSKTGDNPETKLAESEEIDLDIFTHTLSNFIDMRVQAEKDMYTARENICNPSGIATYIQAINLASYLRIGATVKLAEKLYNESDLPVDTTVSYIHGKVGEALQQWFSEQSKEQAAHTGL